MSILVTIDNTLKDISKIKEYLSVNKFTTVYRNISCTLDEYKILAQDLLAKEYYKGLLFTMFAIDAFLVCSKIKNSLVAPVTDELTAERVVAHNNAKLAIFPLNIISIDYAIKLMDIFLNRQFEGGRHSERISMLNSLK